MQEKRENPRIGISFPVECNPLSEGKYFYTVSKDLSLTGIKIWSNQFLGQGNALKLNINVIDRLIRLKAKVAWCNKERISDRYSAGLQFTEINHESKKALSGLLSRIR